MSTTLPFTQTIPAVSVQQDVEEIEEIPEFNISQSVAAKVTVMIDKIMIKVYPVLSFLLVMYALTK
jgi:mannose/fructose/N-acetylgalactosamine-specific phosphotransferase system component IID